MSAIFKRDFRSYFMSPVGYVYVGAFILTMNLFFFLNNIQYSNPYISETFSFMMMVMMFTTPILTMRTFSEEFRQKTDQLILTSPVKLWSIVAGKLLAAYAVFCSVMALSLVWLVIISIFGEMNTAEVVGNYAAMLVVAGVYVSIGIFVSALTENQIVAALGTLGIFVALFLVSLAVTYMASAMPVWLVTVLSFFSIFGRYSVVSQGVFSIADIFFFISFASIFLFLTVRVLEKKRWA